MKKLLDVIYDDLAVSERARYLLVVGAVIVIALLALTLANASPDFGANVNDAPRAPRQVSNGEFCCEDSRCIGLIAGNAASVAGGYRIDAAFAVTGADTASVHRVSEFWPIAEARPSAEGAAAAMTAATLKLALSICASSKP